MNIRPTGYLIVCALALVYLVTANARGYIPFAGSTTRSSGEVPESPTRTASSASST